MRNTEIARSDDMVTIVGSGALDFTNCEDFHAALVDSSGTAERLVVDLRPSDFIDTAVLEYLARAANAMRRRGKNLEVICLPDSHPLSVLHITNIDTLMTVMIKLGTEPMADSNDSTARCERPELGAQ